MHRCIFLTAVALFLSCGCLAVELVKDGKPLSEIVLPEKPSPSVKIAGEELQKYIEKMSGAKLPMVFKVSPDVKNQVFVGESDYTRKLGARLDDIKYDGFRIIAEKNHVILAGREFYLDAESFSKFRDVDNRQDAWEKYCGQKWRFPPIHNYSEFSKECGFHSSDGTGTLYAAYELLEQLGMRWYMPMEETGIVIPNLKNISVKDQNIKKEPEFSQRILTDSRVGLSKNEFLWYKSMKVGTAFVLPIYHSLSGPLLKKDKGRDEQPAEYFGMVKGKPDYSVPKLTSEKLRTDFIAYLEAVDKAFPGIRYTCIGQPDGWSGMDSADRAAGWDKLEERGQTGRFSDYYWDFIFNIRNRYMQKHPDRKFTVFAYGCTRRPPAGIDKVPENITVVFCQTCQFWTSPDRSQELKDREEWLKKLDSREQLLIWEYYLQYAPWRNFPPVPVFFSKIMQQNFKGLYDHSTGFIVEIGSTTQGERDVTNLGLRRPILSHLMIYLHNRLCWDRNLDMQAVLNEYYELFFGPAKAEMKEFHEFAEEVWNRPETRQISATGGFLKAADVDKYFEILKRAKAKAGDSVYGKRIDLMATEMEPLKILFQNLGRPGPRIRLHEARFPAKIDGDLSKQFWNDSPTSSYTFYPLLDMATGQVPKKIRTSASFRWLPNGSGLIIGIVCQEPEMNKIREKCMERDSETIYSDDIVEVLLETPQGMRPKIVINPAGSVLDECIGENVADLPEFYTVKDVAVKKYPDRWTVELEIDVKSISGERPTPAFPWGVNVCRQRLAGSTPEYYVLSPGGANFREIKCTGNLTLRK